MWLNVLKPVVSWTNIKHPNNIGHDYIRLQAYRVCFNDILLQGTWKHAYAYDYGSFERFKAQYEYSCGFVSAMDPVFTRDKFLNKNLFRQCGKV